MDVGIVDLSLCKTLNPKWLRLLRLRCVNVSHCVVAAVITVNDGVKC